jgi:hypothetical protein
MSTRTDALVSQQETGKITASIVPITAGCHPAHAMKHPSPNAVPLRDEGLSIGVFKFEQG